MNMKTSLKLIDNYWMNLIPLNVYIKIHRLIIEEIY